MNIDFSKIDQTWKDEIPALDADVMLELVKSFHKTKLAEACIKMMQGVEHKPCNVHEFVSILATVYAVGYHVGENEAVDTYCANLEEKL